MSPERSVPREAPAQARDHAGVRLDDELALKTASGLTLEGEAVLVIEGHSSITGKPAKVKLTDYGFEFFGDITEIARIRNARCCYIGTVHTAKEG